MANRQRRQRPQRRVTVENFQTRGETAPAASPVDSYSPPQAPDEGPARRQSQLAEAIGGFYQPLNQAAQMVAEDRQEAGQREAHEELSQMSVEEAQAAVEAGDLEQWENPHFKDAFMRQFGQRVAGERRREASEWFATEFNPDTDNVDDVLTQQAQEDIEAFGGDNTFIEGYSQVMDPFADQLRDQATEARTERVQEEVRSGAFQGMLTQMDMVLDDGGDAHEAVKAGRAKYQENKEEFGLSFREQDELMVAAAQQYALQGEVELVEAIFEDGRDGVGPLGRTKRFQAQAAELKATAQQVRLENQSDQITDATLRFNDEAHTGSLDRDELVQYHKDHPGHFTDQQVNQLIRRNETEQQRRAEAAEARHREAIGAQNEKQAVTEQVSTALEHGMQYVEGATYIDGDGEEQEISRNQMVDRVQEAFMEHTDRDAQNQLEEGADPAEVNEQRFNRQYAFFEQSGETHPQWERIINSAPQTVNYENIGQDPEEAPSALHDAIGTYLNLHARNPGMAHQHVQNERDLQFYEMYRIGTQELGYNDQQSMRVAARVAHRAEAETDQERFRRNELMRDKLEAIGDGGLAGFFQTRPENMGDVKGAIMDKADFYSVMGMGREEAIKRAADHVDDDWISINGFFMPATDVSVPPDFPDVAESLLQSYAEDTEEEFGLSADDLTLRPDAHGGQTWYVAFKDDGMPVYDGARFDQSDIMRLREEQSEERRKEMIRDANQSLRESMEPPQITPGPPSSTPQSLRERQEENMERRREAREQAREPSARDQRDRSGRSRGGGAQGDRSLDTLGYNLLDTDDDEDDD